MFKFVVVMSQKVEKFKGVNTNAYFGIYLLHYLPCSIAGDLQVKEHSLPKVVPQWQLNIAW